MEEQQLIARVVEQFEQLDIPYMLTGSIAVSYYGAPRATHDIDIVVAISREQSDSIRDKFLGEFYVSDIESAVQHHQAFNLIHQGTLWKIDCWIHDEGNPYRHEAFSRRQRFTLWGKSVFMISKEDLILSKLLWYQEAESDVHLRDIRGILEFQEDSIDFQYIDHWCSKLSLTNLWSKLTM